MNTATQNYQQTHQKKMDECKKNLLEAASKFNKLDKVHKDEVLKWCIENVADFGVISMLMKYNNC